MIIKHDGLIDIATGVSASSKIWQNKKIKWSDFVDRLGKHTMTSETYKEFIAMSKAEQGRVKDVGGYVGGYLRNGRRKPEFVVHRHLLTLDIDFAHNDFWADFTLMYDCAAVLHATHKHCEASPRYRLIIPLSRSLSADEYLAVSRRLAGDIGIDLFDNTTFEPNRLMFWPSIPRDVAYYIEVQDGEWLDADKVLAQYADWRDTSLWPSATAKINADRVNAAKKQEDPTEKKGIVGAFCRSYTISEAIASYLGDVYSETIHPDRYTYAGGSAAAGLIVYEDKYAYSHHGTDPVGGKLVNSFDLVRLHRYGSLDADTDEHTQVSRTPSFKAMADFAREDGAVKELIMRENLDAARYDFADVEQQEQDISWAKEMEMDSKGKYANSSVNINLIFANDTRLRGIFKRNDFDSRNYVFASLPWRRVKEPEPVRDVDYAGVRNYIETIYGISGAQKIEDALELEFERNRYHPIQDYFNSLEWDAKPRVDTLLHDYFGVEDTLYSREAIRKMLVGAVARVKRPGVKFDLVLTLVGAQGTGKSSFVRLLGRQWFSDTFLTVQGKEALEQIQGSWLIEIAELAGLRKAEVEGIKHFISKQEDTFRKAYGRVNETYKRQCVFFGTTNNPDFLRDPSGNRRFLPVDINPGKARKSVLVDLEDEVDQIWAEAVQIHKQGETLYLSPEAEKHAKYEQSQHSESDERKGLIERYLDRLLPSSWDMLDVGARRLVLSEESTPFDEGKQRDAVCVAEIWCECLGKQREDMSRYNTKEINDIMKSFDNWRYTSKVKDFAGYGKQRYYERLY